MSKIIKHGDDYFVEFWGNGLRFQKKAGKSLAGAEAMLKAIDAETARAAVETGAGGADKDEFFRRFQVHAQKEYAVETVRRFRAVSSHFGSFLKERWPGVNKVYEITPKVVENYRHFLTGEKVGLKLINFTVFLLDGIFNFGIKAGYINDNPCAHVFFNDGRSLNASRTLSLEERKSVSEKLEEREKAAFVLLCYTGMRVREIGSLCWSHVKFDLRRVHVPESGWGRERDIALLPDVISCLERIRTEGVDGMKDMDGWKAIFPEEVLRELKNKLRAKGKARAIKGPLALSVLRDTFVAMLLERGVAFARIFRILGYHDIARMARYLR